MLIAPNQFDRFTLGSDIRGLMYMHAHGCTALLPAGLRSVCDHLRYGSSWRPSTYHVFTWARFDVWNGLLDAFPRGSMLTRYLYGDPPRYAVKLVRVRGEA